MSMQDRTEWMMNLPRNVDKWSKSDETRVYLPENLFEYIDGGAELYISYGFIKMWSLTYRGPAQPDITVDIFKMKNSQMAFGLFSHSRERENAPVGQGGEYGGGLLHFWKGTYYVSISSYPETQESADAIHKIGTTITDHIEETGILPIVLTYLPQQGLLNDKVRYFTHYKWINSYFFISTENVFQLNDRTEVVIAPYDIDSFKIYLLIVNYSDLTEANRAFKKCKYLYPDWQNDQIAFNNGKWTGLWQIDHFIILINGPVKDRIEKLAKAVETNIKNINKRED